MRLGFICWLDGERELHASPKSGELPKMNQEELKKELKRLLMEKELAIKGLIKVSFFVVAQCG